MALLLAVAAIFAPMATAGFFFYPVTDTADFLVTPLVRQQYLFELRCDPENPKTVLRWREETGGDIAFNAGFFDENLRPVGYAKTATDEWGDPQNHPALIGLSLGKDTRILPKENFDESVFDFAVSGFPLLLWDGDNLFQNETGKYDRRTIIGIKNDIPYLFVSARGHPSLAESAAALERFGVQAALNLDGGTSTGFSADFAEIYSIAVPCALIGYFHSLTFR